MRIEVNGIRLFFDVEGAGLVPDGPEMRERPTVLLLHGGPGADHSIYKPAMRPLADVAQVVYLDHRGNGRSDRGGPASWTLAQWADDIADFCDALEITRPILYGASFGGFVAQAFAARHPDRLRALILANTAARFDFPTMYAAFGEQGGPEARAAAEAYWGAPSVAARRHYAEICLPHYYVSARDRSDMFQRIRMQDDVALHFNGPANEMGRMDHRAALANIACPVLVFAGERDPVTPPAFSEAIVAALPPHLTTYECMAQAGHGLFEDQPEAAMAILKAFVRRV